MTTPHVLAHLRSSDPSFFLFTITTTLVIEWACPSAAARVFRRPVNALVGESINDVLPEPLGDWLADVSRRAIEEQTPVSARLVWDGRRYHVNVIPDAASPGETVVAVRPAPRVELENNGQPFELAPFVDLGPLNLLTRRELEVFALLGEGCSLPEIAERFNRSVKTVKRFRDGLARKLGVGDRTRLGMIARDLGLDIAHAGLPRIETNTHPANTTTRLEDLTPSLAKPANADQAPAASPVATPPATPGASRLN